MSLCGLSKPKFQSPNVFAISLLLAQYQLFLLNLSKAETMTIKIFGAALYLGIIVGAAETVGVHSYFDISRFVVSDAEIAFLGN